MKIGIISPEITMGGASIVAQTIGRALNKNGDDVFFISYLGGERPAEEFRYYSLYSKKNDFVKKMVKAKKLLSYKLYGEFIPAKYMKAEIQKLKKVMEDEHPDVIIFNTFIPGVLFSRFLRKSFPNIKLITWMHSDPDYSLNHIAKYYQKEYEKSFTQVDDVVCLTKATKQKLLKYTDNVSIIYNPLTLPIRNKSNLLKKVISFTARLDIEVKGIDYLCEVAKQLPDDWYIRIAGDGSENERKRFETLISSNNVSNKIEFVGPLHGNNLIDHYIESSIFLSTSRSEGLPLVMIEAMSCGLPIVTFDHAGGKELLGDNIYGILVPSFNTDEMSKQILNLITNFELRSKYQNKSLQRSKDFKMEEILAKWNAIISRQKVV